MRELSRSRSRTTADTRRLYKILVRHWGSSDPCGKQIPLVDGWMFGKGKSTEALETRGKCCSLTATRLIDSES